MANDHAPRTGRRVIDGPAVRASTATDSQPLADPVQHPLRAVHDDGQREPVAVRVGHRAQQVLAAAVRAEDDLAGAGPLRRPRARCAAAPGHMRTISACCAPISSRSARPRSASPAADQASSTIPLSTSTSAAADDPRVTQQRPEHDGDAVGPDVHHVAVPSHEPSRSPLAAARGRSAVAGGGREERLVVAAAAVGPGRRVAT